MTTDTLTTGTRVRILSDNRAKMIGKVGTIEQHDPHLAYPYRVKMERGGLRRYKRDELESVSVDI